jgi:hypothetical protein
MSETEKQELKRSMKARTKLATSSKGEAIRYLSQLGVLTKKGNYTLAYKKACTTKKVA